MSKVIFSLIIITCSFKFAFAFVNLNNDLLEWSWAHCSGETIKYSLYRATNETAALIDDEIFNCAQLGHEQSQCEKNKNIQNMSTQSMSFYQICLSNFDQRKSKYDQKVASNCNSSKTKCESCIRDSSCKTFEKGNSDLQNQYYSFGNSTFVGCDWMAKCGNGLKVFAQTSCMTYERKVCVLDWQVNNMRNDTCVDYKDCAFKRQSASILNISALILVAFFSL